MLIASNSKPHFFSTRLFLVLAGFCMVALTLIFWKNNEARNLTKLETTTTSFARAYASESQTKFQNIYHGLQRMAKTEALREKIDLADWEKDANLYFNSYQGLKSLAWVDNAFAIKSILPENIYGNYLNKNAGEIAVFPSEIDILIPIDNGTEIKGFLFAIIEGEAFFQPVTKSVQNDFMLQISVEGNEVYQSQNWETPDRRYLTSQLISLQNSGVWSLTLAPTKEKIDFELKNSRMILLFGLSFSGIALAAILFAQKYNAVSKTSHLRFQKALEGMMEGCQIINHDWQYLFVNETAAAQFHTTKENMIGRPIQEIIPGIQEMDLFHHLQECMNDQISKQILESFTFLEETPAWYELNIVPAPDGIFILSYDVTEQKQMAMALENERNLLADRVEERTIEVRRTNKALLEALQTKDEFLANMSHELRTPLTSILGLSEILELEVRGPLNPEQLHSIQTIYQSGDHLLSLINDILDLSKIEAGKLEIEPGNVVVNDICEASLALTKGMAYNKDLRLVYYLCDPELTIWADARRLKQILVNLLSNAVKFTPYGGEVKLLVDLDRENERTLFIIEDDGIGISPEESGKLFQPFTQLDASLSRTHEGSGLGLSLVRKLAKLHQGDVILESEGIPGKGSRFTVWIPFNNHLSPKMLAAPEHTQPDSAIRTLSPEPDALTKYKHLILLVEDNLSNLEIMHSFLEAADYQVMTAENGQEAVDIALEYSPKLILMDIQMPVMDGLTAIQRLRENEKTKETIIFALTALAMPGDRERCLEAGANDYVTKPVRFKSLLEKIGEYLQKVE